MHKKTIWIVLIVFFLLFNPITVNACDGPTCSLQQQQEIPSSTTCSGPTCPLQLQQEIPSSITCPNGNCQSSNGLDNPFYENNLFIDPSNERGLSPADTSDSKKDIDSQKAGNSDVSPANGGTDGSKYNKQELDNFLHTTDSSNSEKGIGSPETGGPTENGDSEASTYNKQELDNLLHTTGPLQNTPGNISGEGKKAQQQTLASVLDSVQESMGNIKGIYWALSFFDQNIQQKVERSLYVASMHDFGEKLEDPAGSICSAIIKPPKPESSISLKMNQLIPSLQLQALRSSKITYPGYYPEIDSILHPSDIVLTGNEPQTTDLYYYKITFSLSNIAEKNGTYEINLVGKANNIEYAINLNPQSNSSTSLLVNSRDTISASGSTAIMKYWPVLLDEVCLKLKDPNYVLKTNFVKNPVFKKEGGYLVFCTPVILGTNAETDAPVGEPDGTSLQ